MSAAHTQTGEHQHALFYCITLQHTDQIQAFSWRITLIQQEGHLLKSGYYNDVLACANGPIISGVQTKLPPHPPNLASYKQTLIWTVACSI